jgi:hypothetical protein
MPCPGIMVLSPKHPFEHVAKQLGHGSTQMATSTYGRYVPTHDERRAWERNFTLAQTTAAARAF